MVAGSDKHGRDMERATPNDQIPDNPSDVVFRYNRG